MTLHDMLSGAPIPRVRARRRKIILLPDIRRGKGLCNGKKIKRVAKRRAA